MRVIPFADPGIVKFGPIVKQQQERRSTNTADEHVQKSQSFRIDPVEIFEDHDQRLQLSLVQ